MSDLTRKMTVTLEIEVEALSGEDLAESGFFEGVDDEGEGEEMTNIIADYDPPQIAAQLPYVIEQPDNEMFAGSGLFVKINNVRVVSSRWSPA